MQHCFFQIFFEILEPVRKICQRVIRILLVIPLLIFGFEFLGMAPVSWLQVRHFALILNLKMNGKQGGTSSLGACSASFLNESCDSDAEDDTFEYKMTSFFESLHHFGGCTIPLPFLSVRRPKNVQCPCENLIA